MTNSKKRSTKQTRLKVCVSFLVVACAVGLVLYGCYGPFNLGALFGFPTESGVQVTEQASASSGSNEASDAAEQGSQTSVSNESADSQAPNGVAAALQSGVPIKDADDLRIGMDHARENTSYLQGLMNSASEQGGGVIRLPEGVFYFGSGGAHTTGNYALMAVPNVTLIGAGQDKTVLMPVGSWKDTGLYPHGIDMFFYDGKSNQVYLENVHFSDFTIDGIYAKGDPALYNASGKGFFFELFENCTWEQVTVKNTDGTGFGVDFPINSSIINCTAENCGKNASTASVGASGFGIGTGASSKESILIRGCQAYDNKKYGFFFEHQSIFGTRIKSEEATGFVVTDCVASGNRYNFGGNRANDVTYERCTSKLASNQQQEKKTQVAFYFGNHSYRITMRDCVVEQRCGDVIENSALGQVFEWAAARGVVNMGQSSPKFHPGDVAKRSDAVVLLWRYAGYPGSMLLRDEHPQNDTLEDVSSDSYYLDAITWLRDLTLSNLNTFKPDGAMTLGDFCTYLWRMAGSPAPADNGVNFNGTIDPDRYYASALTWAYQQGIIDGTGNPRGVGDAASSTTINPDRTLLRSDIIFLLKAFDEALH